MAKQVINIGTAANDGTGDPLRTAFDKVNDNFNELYGSSDVDNTYHQIGVFAALQASSTTTITQYDEFVPINGNFSNTPMVGFTLVADPAIKYTGANAYYFKIDIHASIKMANAGREISIGIKKNGNLVTESVMTTYLKNNNELYAISSTCVVSLYTDDTIQLVVSVSDAAHDITFATLNTAIKPFITDSLT